MILAITPNPSIDISYSLEDFRLGEIHKIQDQVKTPGGKGINVSKVLKLLGEDPLCAGFLGGQAGEYIEQELNDRGIRSDFVRILGETRTCYAIRSENDGQITEMREKGPVISKSDVKRFFNKLLDRLSTIKTLTCSGSLPLGLGQEFYEELLQKSKGKKLILDTSGDFLKNIVLESSIKPFAIKPNVDEIVDIFGRESKERKALELLKDDRLKDIPIVVLSMGSKGAIAKYFDRFYSANVPKINAINPVGSGDSSLAGLAYGLDHELDFKETLSLSMACGVLNAMEKEIGHINVDRLEEIKGKIEIKELP